MSNKIKAGVIGVGFMGQLHCKTYASYDETEFIGVYDADQTKCLEVAAKFSTKAYADLELLISDADVLSICVPTVLHKEVAIKCIAKNKSILIEKPIAATYEEATAIEYSLKDNGVTAAVGFIERFNPCTLDLLNRVMGLKIRKISACRLAPPVDRANDVSVVFDLMIHDLDIITALTGSSEYTLTATGTKINSPVLNDVSADIVFDNGICALVKSSKVADQKMRQIIVECDECIIEADLLGKTILEKRPGAKYPERVQTLGEEPIKAEIVDFVKAVKEKSEPKVSAVKSLKPFKLACDIEKAALSK